MLRAGLRGKHAVPSIQNRFKILLCPEPAQLGELLGESGRSRLAVFLVAPTGCDNYRLVPEPINVRSLSP